MSRKRDQLDRELGGTLVLTSHDDVIKKRKGADFYCANRTFSEQFWWGYVGWLRTDWET